MRIYLIILETYTEGRKIEVLATTNDSTEALRELIHYSDQWEASIVEGMCRVYMTTYVE